MNEFGVGQMTQWVKGLPCEHWTLDPATYIKPGMIAHVHNPSAAMEKGTEAGEALEVHGYTSQTTEEFVASEMAQQKEAFSSKHGDLCLTPGNHRRT